MLVSNAEIPAKLVLPPGWRERGWEVRTVGNVECFVYDGRAAIEEIRQRVDTLARSRRP